MSDDDEDQEVLYDRGDQDFWDDDESDKPRMRVVLIALVVIMAFVAGLTWIAVQVFT